ncbi:DUF1573 domain-containing protein [Candidatus Pacebacteria bacterium]|nr:DUF1573 domain-containing protein [Candidatus Paceibacterota bacterium]
MNRYLIGVIALGIILLGYAMISSDQDNVEAVTNETSSAKIVVLEEPYDFGDIDIFAGKVDTTYTLKNEGTEDVTITKAGTSCMCTEGVIAGLTFGMHGSDVKSVVIPAGGEEKVKAIYDPLAHGPGGTGPVTRTLMIETNSSKTSQIELRFSANVVKNEN